jgi:hypothetical protein
LSRDRSFDAFWESRVQRQLTIGLVVQMVVVVVVVVSRRRRRRRYRRKATL